MSKEVSTLASRLVYFSIINSPAAKSLASHLVKSADDSIILPFTDHPGPITEAILSRPFKSLTVCERDPALRESFAKYVKQIHPDKNVQVYSDDLFDLSFKTYSDKAQKRCSEIVKESLGAGQGEICDKHVKFLVPLLQSRYEVAFLRNLYYQMCLRLGLCSNSLIHYYFLMSDRQCLYLNSRHSENMALYRSSTVLYNTIFKIRTLESYDLRNCFGISIRKIQKTAANRNPSYKKVHLLWLEPRLDVISSLSPRSLVEFRFLVTQMMQKRRCLVVTFLDKFFNDFREDLFQLGIDETTQSGDLDKEQYYKLYLYLRNREDYSRSTFLQAAAQAEDNMISLEAYTESFY